MDEQKKRLVIEIVARGEPGLAERACDALGTSLGPWVRDKLTENKLAGVSFRVVSEEWVPINGHDVLHVADEQDRTRN